MDIQLILVIAIGLTALIYVLKIIKNQLTQNEKDPKCEKCHIIKDMNEDK